MFTYNLTTFNGENITIMTFHMFIQTVTPKRPMVFEAYYLGMRSSTAQKRQFYRDA